MAGEHRPPLTPLPIPLTKDHHCCKKTAHGRRSRFLHNLGSGNPAPQNPSLAPGFPLPRERWPCPSRQFRVSSGAAAGDHIGRARSTWIDGPIVKHLAFTFLPASGTVLSTSG